MCIVPRLDCMAIPKQKKSRIRNSIADTIHPVTSTLSHVTCGATGGTGLPDTGTEPSCVSSTVVPVKTNEKELQIF